jgi:cyclase
MKITDLRLLLWVGRSIGVAGAVVIAAFSPLVAQLAAQSSARQQSSPMQTQRLRDSAWVVAGFSNGNVLAVAAGGGILLVDAQSADYVGVLDSAIRSLPGFARAPVRYVVNTHYHEDHTGGNAFYRRRAASIVAQRGVPTEMRKDTVIPELGDFHRRQAPEASMPNTLFSDSTLLRLGTLEVRVFHASAAHTGSDAIVWIPAFNIMHIGDILEVDAPPFIDVWAGGSIDGMLGTIDSVSTMINDSTLIVPGHGRVSRRADLADYRAMLATLRDRVRQRVARGASETDVLNAGLAGEYEARLGGANPANRLVRWIYLSTAQQRRR